MTNLHSGLLRTFIAVAETGSMTLAADRIHRTQSAASLHIKRLEDTLNQPLFHRHGRGVTLTPTGERLLPAARRITALLDDTLRDLVADTLAGSLRLGIPDDQGHDTLAQIIAEFIQSHPLVEVEVICDLSTRFPALLQAGELDLAIYELETPADMQQILWRDQTHWVMSCQHDLLARDPLPVALFDRNCWWRDAALSALDSLNRPYRVIYSSQSVLGITAAVEAGAAVALLGSSALGDGVRALGPGEGFPLMPISHLVLGAAGPETPARATMEAAIRHAFAQRVGQLAAL